jgi:hypothetical protein
MGCEVDFFCIREHCSAQQKASCLALKKDLARRMLKTPKPKAERDA